VKLSRLDWLLLIGIVVVLVGLLVPLVGDIRRAAARAQCAHNLKAIGVAMHAANDLHKRLPPVNNCYPNPADDPQGTVLYHLLPFLNLRDIHRKSKDSNALTNLEYTISGFLCSADPSPPNATYAEANYAPNFLIFDNQPGGSISIQQLLDGTSNTVGFAERRGRNSSDDIGCWSRREAAAGAWVDYGKGVGREAKYTFQSRLDSGGTPGAAPLNADGSNAAPDNWHEIHANGINILLMDGGVFFKASTTPRVTWSRLCDPSDLMWNRGN
jgi:hypothetical protein